jgi:hypothetical protein
MFDHVSIGVADIGAAKRFYNAALEPLGYQCISEGADALGYGRDRIAFWILALATRCQPMINLDCIFALRRRHGQASMRFMPPRLLRAGATMASRAFAPSTRPITMLRLSQIPPGIGSKPIAPTVDRRGEVPPFLWGRVVKQLSREPTRRRTVWPRSAPSSGRSAVPVCWRLAGAPGHPKRSRRRGAGSANPTRPCRQNPAAI